MKLRTSGALLAAIILAAGAPCAYGDEQVRQHTESIDASDHEYTITMGGTLDGPTTRDPIGYGEWSQAFEPMRLVRIENVGDAVVVNPWVFTDDRGHWRSVQELTEHVTAPYEDELDRALAMWWWETRHRWHFTTQTRDNNDPVKVWNIFGHTLCGNDAHVLADCFRTIGLTTRHPRIVGHSVTEAFADGKWRLLDGDENIIALLRDNETVASESDIRRDHDLLKRTHCYGILRADDQQIREFSASLYGDDNQPEPDADLGSHIGHEMTMTLRPGEAITWAWEQRGKFHCPWDYERVAERVARMTRNGYWEFTPRLTAERIEQDPASATGVSATEGVLTAGADGGEMVYRIAAPWALVGGSLAVGAQGEVAAALSWDGEQWLPLEFTAGESGRVADLDAHFPYDGPLRFEYFLRLTLAPGATVRSLYSRTDLQMAPLCMPYLTLGDNAIRYMDETEGPRRVEVTHEWVETDANRPPNAPAEPVFPADGATIDRTQFAFEWEAPEDPDGDAVEDYQFMLSRYEDMRWPMSPNFFKLSSKTADAGAPKYTLLHRGLLNPEETYYWRVRARDEHGAWSDWSDVWTFRPGGPGVPPDVALEVDREARTATLTWRANPQGATPARFKIYGSDEQGFSVSDEPYDVYMGNQEGSRGWHTFAANLLAETEGHAVQVLGADLDQPSANRAFYRVVAVDAAGVESGPSDFVALPRPLIFTEPPAEVTGGAEFSYQPATVRSFGDLRCRRIDGKPYNAAYWDAEQPAWRVVDAPGWLSIDAATGALTGTAPDEAGEHRVTVGVTTEGVGEDTRQFTVRVR